MKSPIFYKVLFGCYIPPNNTNYQIDKSNKLLHRDNLGRKQKRETKSQENRVGNFAGCKILQPLRNCFLFYASTVLLSGFVALSSN